MQPPQTVTPGVRRRKPSKGDRTSQAILDSAVELLAERDISEITIDELASGAGISRSAFYFHFESREAVLHVLSEQLVGELYATLGAWTQDHSEAPGEALRNATAGSVAIWRRHGAVLRAAVRARETNPQMRAFWNDAAKQFMGSVAEHIEAERASGAALPAPPAARTLARVLVSMNDEVFYEHSRSRRSSTADREIIDTLTTVWLRSIYGS